MVVFTGRGACAHWEIAGVAGRRVTLGRRRMPGGSRGDCGRDAVEGEKRKEKDRWRFSLDGAGGGHEAGDGEALQHQEASLQQQKNAEQRAKGASVQLVAQLTVFFLDVSSRSRSRGYFLTSGTEAESAGKLGKGGKPYPAASG